MAGAKGRDPRGRRGGAVAVIGTLALLAGAMGAHAADQGIGRIERIDLKGDGSSTKVIIMLSRPIAFDIRVLDGDAAQKTARRLVLDFGNTTLAPEVTKPIDVGNALLRQVRTGQFNAETARIVLELTREATHSVEAFESPPHVTIALAGPGSMGAPSTGASDAPKPSAKTIPIRARWRKPYSLLFPR